MDGVSAGQPPECLDSQVVNQNNECVQCVVNEDCDDGNPCNGMESCQDETCVPSTDPCLLTPEQDICQPADNEAGYVCARVECVTDGECDGETPFCANGTCVACLENSHCDDGAPCNGEETCNASNECENGTPVLCGDGDACNGVETCDDNTGECVDGEDPCLATDALDICVTITEDPGYECEEVACIQNSDCGYETPYCNTNNICVACMSDDHCSDGGACNGVETCNFTTGTCEPGTPVVCDDGDACNGIETCDDNTGACVLGTDPCLATEAIDVCEQTDNVVGYICQEVACIEDSHCDDGLGCTGVESCNDNNTCETTGDPCAVTTALDVCVETGVSPFYSCELIECLESSDCTDPNAPYCSESNTCVACLENNHCQDNNPCNGAETCSSSNACVMGSDPCLETPAIDVCVTTDVDDGYICEEVGCLTDADCGDDNLCNGTESCNLDTNECVTGTDTIECNDGNLCNGTETCESSTGECLAGAPVCETGTLCEEDAASLEGYLCLEVGLLQLQAGGDKTCGLSNTNDLYCWGSNINGSLVPQDDGAGGFEEPVTTYLTNAVYLSSDVKRVAVGRNDDGYGNHICFIEASEDHDNIYCQGSQLFGMLGDGEVPTLADDFINNYLGAGYVTTLPEEAYVDIAAGSAHTCVVSARGELYCWGFSAHGQTGGVGYYEEARPTPTLVSGFPEGSKVVSVAAGLFTHVRHREYAWRRRSQ